MKKRLLAFAMVLAICLSIAGTALAEPKLQLVITPRSAVVFSSGISHVSGSNYTVWASAGPVLPEQVTVGFSLYKVVGSVQSFITSDSASGYGYYVYADKTVSLSAGRYKLNAWYIGETESGSSAGYYNVP